MTGHDDTPRVGDMMMMPLPVDGVPPPGWTVGNNRMMYRIVDGTEPDGWRPTEPTGLASGRHEPFARPGMAERPCGLAWLIPTLILGVGMWAAIIAIAVWIVRALT